MKAKNDEKQMRRERQRRAKARKEAAKLREVQRLRDAENMTISDALKTVGLSMPHSTFHERMQRLRLEGEEGLIDKRQEGPTSEVTPKIRGFLVGVAKSEPKRTAQEMVPLVAEQFGVKLTKRRLQSVLQEEGVARPRGTPGHAVRTERISGLGLQVLKVVDERTGYSAGLAQVITEKAVSVPAPEPAIPIDRSGRDEKGKFVSEYNAPRPRRDPKVGAVFESVDIKRREKDLTRLTLRTSRVETIQKKLLCLMALPMVCDGGRFDGATDPRGALLAGLGGLAYMPATLQKFAGELKYVGVSGELMETHARFWLEHMQSCLGVKAASLVVYVDGTTKPLWTELFHKSGKVSSVGRVMPSLESVLLCAGPGVPLYLQTFSGHAPLVNHLLPTLERVEDAIGGGMFSRLTVVDSAANAFEVLRELHLATPRRLFITPLRSEQIKELNRIEGLNVFYEYRDGDWIGEGTIKLYNSKNREDEPLSLRAIIIEQRGKGTFVGYCTNAPVEDFTAAEVADDYYSRWPCQEGVIRDLNGGAAFKTVHGYGKSRVLNVSVITEIEKLQTQLPKLETRLQNATKDKILAERRTHDATVLQRRLKPRNETAAANVESLEQMEKTHTKAYADAQAHQREIALLTRESEVALREAQHEANVESARVEKIQKNLEKKRSQRTTLESRREIYQTDVELDQTFSALKLGWLCLIWTALHQFFDGLKMQLSTFTNEILALDGYRTTTSTVETIQLIANPRNRPLMEKLEKACERINSLKHKRGRRVVRFELVWPAGSARPP